MKIGLFSRFLKDENTTYVQGLITMLLQHSEISLVIYEDFYSLLVQQGVVFSRPVDIFSSEEPLLAEKIDYLFSIGGDGTLLNTITVVKDSGVPVLGINLGRLGFLAQLNRNALDRALEDLAAQNYTLNQRTLLQLNSQPALFGNTSFALNEFALQKNHDSSLIIIHTYINGQFLNSYWADGLIVSTPTGSTAYSLSCGGPIVHPQSPVFILTPIAPHNLNIRPVIIPDTETLSFEIEGRSECFLCTLDSRNETIDSQAKLSVCKANFMLNLIEFKHDNFFNTLRNKLSWGTDSRN